MKALEITGLLLALGFIFLIDRPKLKAAARPAKYTAVYLSILSICLVLGTLAALELIPNYDDMLHELYMKLFGTPK